MATVFQDKKSTLLVEFSNHGTTVNADEYCKALKNLQSYKKKQAKWNAILQNFAFAW